MHTYVADNREKTVETGDLINAIQKATGKNLAQFFDQWVFRAGHPEYTVRTWWDARKKEANVRVVQAHTTNTETGLFAMPLEFEFYTVQGKRRFKETLEKKSQLFSFRLPSEPTLVLFDPDHWILKKVDFQKSETSWGLQLSEDPHVLGRAQAAQALGRSGSAAAVKVLEQALFKETFWGVQSEIALALASLRTPEAVEVLMRAHRLLKHPKARRGLLTALGDLRDGVVRSRLKSTFRSEASYFAEAQALKSLGRTGDVWLLSAFSELMGRESWNDVLRCGALEAVSALRPPNLVALLKKYTAWGHHQNLRMTAIHCLTQAGGGRSENFIGFDIRPLSSGTAFRG